MIQQLQQFLAPPVFADDEDKMRRAGVILNMSALSFVATLIYSILWILIVPQYSERLIYSVFALIVTGVSFLLVRAKQVRLGGLVFLVGTWLLVTMLTPSAGGTRSPFIGFYILIVTLAALIEGWRTALFFAILGITAGAGMAVLGDMGVTPPPFATPWSAWLSQSTLMILLTATVYLLVRQSENVLRRARNELIERRKAEQALRESEARFRLISSLTSDYAFSARRTAEGDFKHIMLNGAFESITGYSEEELMAVGGWRAVLHPDDRAQDDQDMAELHQNQRVTTELRLITKSGEVRWVRSYGDPLWDNIEQRLIGVNGAVQDITERKRAEQALKESEASFRTMFKAAPYMISVNKLNGTCIDVNRAWLEWGKWSLEEVQGVNVSRLLGIDTRVLNHLNQSMVGARVLNNTELVVVQPNGDLRTLLFSARYVTYGGEPCILINAIDVTENKRIEVNIQALNRDLQRQTRELIALNDINRDISTLTTLDKTLHNLLEKLKTALPLNAFFVSLYDNTNGMLAYPLAYDSGRFWNIDPTPVSENSQTHDILNSGHPVLVNRTAEEIRLRQGKPQLIADTSQVSASIVYAPLMLGKQPIGVISAHSYEMNAYDNTHRDLLMAAAYQIAIAVHNARLYDTLQSELHERKRAEQEVRTLNTDLEERVRQRIREHQASLQELQAFTYTVSHDLRAPLRAIDGFSQTLIQNYSEHLPEKAHHYLKRVQANVQRMGTLVDDLLAFTHIGRIEPKRESIDMTRMARWVIEEYKSDMELGTVEFIISPLPTADADPNLLKQVLINLISNAVKYSSQRANSVIELGATRENDQDVYFIRDNGIGFDMRYADKLFGVFQRLHNDESYAGTGIGLATVHRIIVAHGGRVWAESHVDKGATFFFTLSKGSS